MLNTVITSVRIAHRRNKIVAVLKLLPSRAFPANGKSAGALNMFIYSKRESGSFNLSFIYANHYGKHLANPTNH